jgi:iron complex outermembrane receptor protein
MFIVSNTRISFIFTVAGAALGMSSVQAQQPEADEEVIVYGTTGLTDSFTGSRLELSVLETPATVDIIDGDAIRDRVDLSVNEAVTRSAGFTIDTNPGNGNSTIVARGFAGNNAVTKLYDGNQVLNPAVRSACWPES